MSKQDEEDAKKKAADASGDQGSKNDDSQDQEDQGGVDYKAELEKLQVIHKKSEEDKENYREGMLSAKKKLKDKEDEGGSDEVEDDDIDAKVKAIVDEKLSGINKVIASNTFDSLIGEYSENVDEQALIKYHFENSVSSNLPVRDRIENAQLIANKPLILKTNSELATALKSKMGVSKFSTGAGGNQDQEKVTKEFFSPEQKESLKKRGFTPEMIKQTEDNLKKTQNK